MCLLCVWKFDFCFKLVSYFNTMEGKLLASVSRASVCLQENLYLPVGPWGEGIILFSLINCCLFLLSFLHVAYFRHKDTTSPGFLSPRSHVQVFVVLWSSQHGCSCPILKSFKCISMTARCEGTVPSTLFSSLICSLNQFVVPHRLTGAACVFNPVA